MSTTIDDFEDGDLAEYEHDPTRDGRASIVSSPTLSGSNALAISNENAELISTSGLDTYPSQGEIFNYWVQGTGGVDQINLTYGVQDHNNRYFVRVDFDDNWLMVFKYENAEFTRLAAATSGFTIPEDQWLRVEVYWQTGGTHEVTLFDSGGNVLARISGEDSTWTSGGIGYDGYLASSGGSVYFDSVYRYQPDYTPNDGPAVIDDFEDNDLDEWWKAEETSNVEVVSSPTKDGSYSVKLTGDVTIGSEKGLPNYPSAGDTFSYWVRGESNSGIESGANGIAVKYGSVDGDEYAVYLFYESPELELAKWVNDTYTVLAQDSSVSGLNYDEWYRIEINWGKKGHHWVGLYDTAGELLTRIHAKDETFKSGGVGIWPNTNTTGAGGTYYVDSITMPKSDGSDGNFGT